MRIRHFILAVACSLPGVLCTANAQTDETETKPKVVTLELTEGTWMSLDVSPDGETIVFDLLNDIYSMPSTGGTALMTVQKKLSYLRRRAEKTYRNHASRRMAVTSITQRESAEITMFT